MPLGAGSARGPRPGQCAARPGLLHPSSVASPPPAWRQVVTDAYVSADSGVGIVHQAPAFGAPAARLPACSRAGVAGGGPTPAARGAAACMRSLYLAHLSPNSTNILSQHPCSPPNPQTAGEDDYRVCLANGVIAKGEGMPCPLDDDGRFTAEVTDFAGMYVKVSRRHAMPRLAMLPSCACHAVSLPRRRLLSARCCAAAA